MTEPVVSVVIPTYRRASTIHQVLDALASVGGSTSFEVIVSDDASRDDTLRRVAEWSARHPNVSILSVEGESNAGPGTARNSGWRRSRGQVIAFTDDDCRPTSGWVDAISRPILDDEADIVTGDVRPDPAGTVESLWPHTVKLEGRSPWYETCNIAYRRSLLEELEGFDEACRWGEDSDLGFRAVEAGGRHVHEPSAVVEHEVANHTFARHLRSRVRWHYGVRTFAKHRDRRDRLVYGVFVRRSHVITWIELGGLAIAAKVGPRAVAAAVALILAREARKPSPLPGWTQRLRRAPLLWIRNLVDVGAIATGAVRYRVFVL